MNNDSTLQHTTDENCPIKINTFCSKNIFLKNVDSSIKERFEKLKIHPLAGFLDIENLNVQFTECEKVFQKFKSRKHLIHLGMGGSILSPIVLKDAFAPCSSTVIFIENLDLNYIETQLSNINLKDCVFYVVSKSGSTLETQILMNYFLEKYKKMKEFEKSSDEEILKNYFVLATDSKSGPLRILAEKYQISSLNIPSNLGGRFCAFSCVTFFPALFLGLTVQEFIQGAIEIKKYFLNKNHDSFILKIASYLSEESKKGINQTVFMPYSTSLRSLSNWFAQLWAESLGKISDNNTRVGLTPIVAYGPSDQHSLLQLFKDGPKNKNYFFISLEKFKIDHFILHQKLTQKRFSDVIKAQKQGTLSSLLENQSTIFDLSIENLDINSVGKLMYFFEILTVCTGAALSVDPFDQPGVEHGKKLTWNILTEKKIGSL